MFTSSVHVVRRFGCVGGMENYVYQLVHALAKMGQQVLVLCEHCETASINDNIQIVVLGNAFRKPRWLAQWGFARRVAEYASKLPQDVLIHSHERTSVHHVTTFHGPPFLLRKRRWLDFLSPRIHMWTRLETQELTSPKVRAILPNSDLIGEQLKSLYPMAAEFIQKPAYPGVEPLFSAIEKRSSGYTVGFLGKEWRRKGLDIACQIVSRMQKINPQVHFLVAGCDADEVAHLFKHWPQESYTLGGWVAPEQFFAQVDLLLHPARSEPFGMVIAEANAVGLPVVISDCCGIAELIDQSQGGVYSLETSEDNIERWVKACLDLISNKPTIENLELSWDKLAEQHIELYRSIPR